MFNPEFQLKFLLLFESHLAQKSFNLDFIFEILYFNHMLATFSGYAMLLWYQVDAVLLSTNGKYFMPKLILETWCQVNLLTFSA